jgi:hypothetical protein
VEILVKSPLLNVKKISPGNEEKAESYLMNALIGIIQFLSSLCIILGFFSLYNSNRKIIKHNDDLLMFIKEDMLRLYMTVGLLQTQNSNPIIYEICEQLRRLKGDELPKNDKDFMNLCQTATKNFYGKMWISLKENIDKAGNIDERMYYEKRLAKLSSVMDILESISEDSSSEYLKQVTKEIFHMFSEEEEL